MRFFEERAEDVLIYADTLIYNVIVKGNVILIEGKAFDDLKIQLRFEDSKLISSWEDWPERVEGSQKIKLKNDKKRLILFTDENEIFLEIEYGCCKNI